MIKVLMARLEQGHRTMAFPKGKPPEMPAHFRGRPIVDAAKCREGCDACVKGCPTSAITIKDNQVRVDLGRCIFCPDCAEHCPEEAIRYTQDFRLAVRQREDLIVSGQDVMRLASELNKKSMKLFGRSLKLREVSAGGCNGCESDVNVLGTIGWDLSRFGIQFVASPRHADGVLVTGCVSENMKLALQKTYDAVAAPKLVIAVGACAISGGPFVDHPEQSNGATGMLPVDLFIPGCPPHPLTILDGLLRLLGRVESGQR